MNDHRSLLFLSLLCVSSAWPVLAQAPEPIEIARTSHVDHRMILFDAHDRRYSLPDGEYRNGDGVALFVREGKIAELRGCGDAPCRLAAHATRIVDNRLSIYAEVAIPDGRYQQVNQKGAPIGISFLLADGKLIELVDASQIPKPAPVAPGPADAGKATATKKEAAVAPSGSPGV